MLESARDHYRRQQNLTARAVAEARFTSMSQDMVSLTIETIADMLGGS